MARFDRALIVTVLRGAFARVRSGWAVGHQARLPDESPVPPEHPLAARWCTFGALRAECLAQLPDEREAALQLAETSAKYLGLMLEHLGERVRKESAPRSLMEWNDSPARTQGDVLRIYAKTIMALQRA